MSQRRVASVFAVFLAAASMPTAARSDTLALSHPFSFTISGTSVPSTKYYIDPAANSFQAPFAPLSPSIGTLNGLDIVWNIVLSATATNGATAAGAHIGLDASDYGLAVGTVVYSGMGGGTGNGGGPGATFTMSTVISNSNSYSVGATASLWNSSYGTPGGWYPGLIGTSPYTVAWGIPVGVRTYFESYTEPQVYTASAIGTASVTYHYTPSVPEIDAANSGLAFAILLGALAIIECGRRRKNVVVR